MPWIVGEAMIYFLLKEKIVVSVGKGRGIFDFSYLMYWKKHDRGIENWFYQVLAEMPIKIITYFEIGF